MSNLIKLVFLVVFTAALGGKVLISANVNGGGDILEESTEDYVNERNGQIPLFDEGGLEDAYPPPVRKWKRASYGFWSPHPSDFNPMRRPGTSGHGPRSSKRSDPDTDIDAPYHPVPRSISTRLNNQREYNNLESFFDENGDVRGKRQSPGSFILMKLGRLNKHQQQQHQLDINRKLGRRSTLPYSLKSGRVVAEIKSAQNDTD